MNEALDAAKLAAVCAGIVQVARYAGVPARFLPIAAILAGLIVVALPALGGTGNLLLNGLALGLGATGAVTVVVHAGTGSTGSSDGGAT